MLAEGLAQKIVVGQILITRLRWEMGSWKRQLALMARESGCRARARATFYFKG
eukprot:COSAG06_NODE_19679_length_827_cov_1.126374_1_plen_53_part_00